MFDMSTTPTIRADYDYDPYGRVTKIAETIPSDFQYAGYYLHARSGLNLTRTRQYSATLGRWINRDPIGESGGVNLFGYVGGKPICFVDPLGLRPGDWFTTPREAADDALDSVEESNDPNKVVEYAGQLGQDKGRAKQGKCSFMASPPQKGGPHSSSPGLPLGGLTRYGDYHNHHVLKDVTDENGKTRTVRTNMNDNQYGALSPSKGTRQEPGDIQQWRTEDPNLHHLIHTPAGWIDWHNEVTTPLTSVI